MDIQGGNHGTLQNGATFTPGLVGQAFSFDGSNSYFDYGSHPSLNFAAGASFTIEGWVRTTDAFGPIIVHRHNVSGAPIVAIGVGFNGVETNPGRLTAIVRDDEGSEFSRNWARVTGGVVSDGNWHFFALVRTGGTIELFLDGVSQGTSFSPESDGAITTNLRAFASDRLAVQVGFGSRDLQYLSGAIDEIGIFNRALTPAEIQAIYNARSAGKCRGLAITTSTLPTLQIGQPSSFRFEAVLGRPPYTWSLASGSLPPGMGLGSDGVVTGIPTQAGEFTFSIRVQDSSGSTAARTFTFVALVVQPPPPGLVSRWLAEGNANDTQNLNHGLLQNGAAFAPGRIGLAFSFDGLDDVVLIPHSSSLNLASSHTIAAWAFRISPASPQHLVGKRVGCGFDTNFIQLAIGPGALPSAAVPLNSWSHLAVTYGGGLATHYVNGVVVATSTATLGNNTAPLLIGSSGTCAPFAGLIDDVQIYNRPLSQSEIQSIIQPGVSITTSAVPTLQIGQPASFQFEAAFGQAPYTWSLASGALPPGMTLRSDGLVSGTPSQVGQFTFSIRVQDRLGTSATAVFTQQVVAQQALARVILAEGFESGALDSRMSVRTTGTFSSAPGIKNITNFGSTKAFGFGLSTCGASCFFSFVTTLRIAFPAPEFVVGIAFKEMELFGNWGSGGGIFIDGEPLTVSTSPPGTASYYDFGRLPQNDLQPDTTFRSRSFPVNRAVTTIELRVADITNRSEIYIDDLVIEGLPAGLPEFTAGSIVSAASLQPGLSLTPGQIVTIFGSGFSDPCALGASGPAACAVAQGFPLPVQLGATQVTFNGIPAPLLVVTEKQINLLVPWELSGDTAVVVVRRGQSSSLPARVGLSRQAIGLFSVLSSGAGAGVVLHADGRVVSRSAPIVPGEVLVLYGTGMGAVTPAVGTGVAARVEPISRTTIPMRVFFDGSEGRVLFSGLTPGFSGLYQLNVEAPAFLARNYPRIVVQSDASTSNEVSAGGPSLLDVTPDQVRLGLNSTVVVRGLNFPPNARLRVLGTDLAGARDVAGGLDRLTVSIPANLLRPGRVPIALVDASQLSEAPSNTVWLLVVP